MIYGNYQCCESLKFWYGYGSSDPYLCQKDPDADTGGTKTFVRILRIRIGTLVHLHHSSKIKSKKEVTKQWKSSFSCDDGKIRSRILTCEFFVTNGS
jgi:hypothetical protein